MGTNPQTGVQVSEWGCAVEWLPVLLIENAKEVRQTAAAVESARNEARKDTVSLGHALVSVASIASTTSDRRGRDMIDLNEPKGLPR